MQFILYHGNHRDMSITLLHPNPISLIFPLCFPFSLLVLDLIPVDLMSINLFMWLASSERVTKSNLLTEDYCPWSSTPSFVCLNKVVNAHSNKSTHYCHSSWARWKYFHKILSYLGSQKAEEVILSFCLLRKNKTCITENLWTQI